MLIILEKVYYTTIKLWDIKQLSRNKVDSKECPLLRVELCPPQKK